MTCYHLRCRINIWAEEFRLTCRDCGAMVPDPPVVAAVRPCGCTRDPLVFGHQHE